MQTIYLDISNKGVIQTITAKQADVGRKFQAIITDGGKPYNLTSNVEFSVWYSGASGEGNYNKIGDASAFDIDGNKVTVELIAQMLNNPGEGKLCLIMAGDDGLQLGTWNIPYTVEAIPGVGSHPAEQYFTVLNQHCTIVNKATGKSILLTDSARQPIQSLTLSGTEGSVTVSVFGKNLWYLQNQITGAEQASGTFMIYDLPKGVPLTLSADITKYPDDTATNARVFFGVYYTDGTADKVNCEMDYNNAERDGVARKKFVTNTINPNKTVDYIQCSLLDYSNHNGRNAKAENIQIEIGSAATDYEPYIEPQTLTVAAPAELGYTKLHTNQPVTTITNDVGAIMEVEYVADTKTYIDNKFNELAAALVNNT
jgi:hypothetical protein